MIHATPAGRLATEQDQALGAPADLGGKAQERKPLVVGQDPPICRAKEAVYVQAQPAGQA
ncbi:MAG: hypothetical protein M3355_04660 [Actinomycetota bacterium]|nr:hypothetical protein [Actinomycetota bacterium]